MEVTGWRKFLRSRKTEIKTITNNETELTESTSLAYTPSSEEEKIRIPKNKPKQE